MADPLCVLDLKKVRDQRFFGLCCTMMFLAPVTQEEIISIRNSLRRKDTLDIYDLFIKSLKQCTIVQ